MQDGISRKNWTLIWVLGMAGQICWNIENSWFNTFVYDKIAKDPAIIAWMVAVSAVTTTVATLVMGTWSDRIGKRKPFIAIGYILWGLFTIVFGAAEFLPKSPILVAFVFVVAADAVMSFFGSVGGDAGFSAWTTDISNERNRGKIGGVFAAMPVIATIFGAVVSGIIVDALDFFPFFIIMGGIVIAVGIMSMFTLKDHPGLKARQIEQSYLRQLAGVFNVRTVKQNKELFWVFTVSVVNAIGFNVYFPYITIYFNNYLGMDYTTSGAIQGLGLVAAVMLTIPAARFIDRGKVLPVVLFAMAANFAGLIFISLSSHMAVLIVGIFGAGVGFVLVAQTLTAWVKNLYPEDQRGQFEGVGKIFSVCLPMIIGPAISSIVISRYGVHMEIDGVAGMVPKESLFVVSAFMSLLTLIPLIPASRMAKARLQRKWQADLNRTLEG